MLERLVRAFLYHPTRLDRAAPLPLSITGAQEVWISARDGTPIHGLYWPAPQGRPTLLYLHGNAQTVFEWSGVATDLAPLEAGLLLIDYPGYGKSGGEPHEEALYAAAHGALDWLAERVEPGRTAVLGKSLGGGVATEAVAGRPLLGLILESTFCSVPSMIGRSFPMIPAGGVLRSERYASAERIGALELPILMVHGALDEVVPLDEGRALFEAAHEPKELMIVNGAGHNDVAQVAGTAYGTRLRAWLDGLA